MHIAWANTKLHSCGTDKNGTEYAIILTEFSAAQWTGRPTIVITKTEHGPTIYRSNMSITSNPISPIIIIHWSSIIGKRTTTCYGTCRMLAHCWMNNVHIFNINLINDAGICTIRFIQISFNLRRCICANFNSCHKYWREWQKRSNECFLPLHISHEYLHWNMLLRAFSPESTNFKLLNKLDDFFRCFCSSQWCASMDSPLAHSNIQFIQVVRKTTNILFV